MIASLNSAIEPAGPQALHIAGLWWIMVAVCTVVFVIVLTLLLIAVLRRRNENESAQREEEAGSEGRCGSWRAA